MDRKKFTDNLPWSCDITDFLASSHAYSIIGNVTPYLNYWFMSSTSLLHYRLHYSLMATAIALQRHINCSTLFLINLNHTYQPIRQIIALSTQKWHEIKAIDYQQFSSTVVKRRSSSHEHPCYLQMSSTVMYFTWAQCAAVRLVSPHVN